MAGENHNQQEENWAKLLDLLEGDAAQVESLTEKQKQQLEELRALVAETSDALEVYARLDADQGWLELRSEALARGLVYSEATSSPANGRVQSLWRWVLVAASLLIALTLGGYYFYQQSNQKEMIIATASDVAPGGNNATLVLSDGQSIALRSDQEGITVSEYGTYYPDGSSLSDIGEVAYATLHIPRAGQYQLTLPDGTKAWLNSDSKLTYPIAFTDNERVVRLEGEAYFEVKHHDEKPFLVQCDDHEVQVLGTSFNIQSYTDMSHSRVTLVQGSVQLRNQAGMSQILRPNEQAFVSNDRLSVQQVNAQQHVAWKDGIFVLDKQDIQSIIPQLERWYDVEFNRTGIPEHTATLSGEIPRDISLSTVLSVLGEQLNLQFEIRERRVMVKG